MAKEAQLKISPSALSFRILHVSPDLATAEEAALAVQRFLERKRPGLAEALRIAPAGQAVVLRARGEAPEALLVEAREFLLQAEPVAPERVTAEIDVDPAEFALAPPAAAGEEPPAAEREILHSTVRHFPHPICEWFEISTGNLVLTSRRIRYRPEQVIVPEEATLREEGHLILLDEIEEFGPGEWWDVPCLMLRTPERVYRYGWAAARGEERLIFEVDEWIEQLRNLIWAEE